jgi:hypothetical protein
LVKINPSVVLAIHLQEPLIASVMELVDVPDSKSGAARRVGSSPTRGTTDGSFDANCFPKRLTKYKAPKPILASVAIY